MKHLLYLLAEHLFFLYTPSALCHFSVFQALKVKVAHLCPTLCDPMGYPVHGILQARILE